MPRHRAYRQQTTWSWQGTRVWFAAGILVLAIVVTSISSFSSALRVCEGPTGEPPTCRSLSLVDPPVMLTLILALGFLLPDVQRLRIGADGVEFEKDTVGEGENVIERIDVLERKVSLYEDPEPASGEEADGATDAR